MEELLRDLPARISEEEHATSKVITLDEANEVLLHSDDNALVSEVLFSLKI